MRAVNMFLRIEATKITEIQGPRDYMNFRSRLLSLFGICYDLIKYKYYWTYLNLVVSKWPSEAIQGHQKSDATQLVEISPVYYTKCSSAKKERFKTWKHSKHSLRSRNAPFCTALLPHRWSPSIPTELSVDPATVCLFIWLWFFSCLWTEYKI